MIPLMRHFLSPMIAFLCLLAGTLPVFGAVTVNFPSPPSSENIYDTIYGYPYFTNAGDNVIGYRSDGSLPSVNQVSISLYVEVDDVDFFCDDSTISLYFDNQYLGSANIYRYGFYTYLYVYGTISTTVTNASPHAIEIVLDDTIYNSACDYSWIEFDDYNSYVTMDLIGADNDGDGYYSVSYYGNDCDDSDPGDHPGATETCNGDDEDCDGVVDDGVSTTYYRDSDGDGYGSSTTTQACSKPSGYTTVSGDCNDSNAAIYPGATETCNSVDDDCDSVVDEGVTVTYYRDSDGDSYGTTSTTTTACSKPSGYSTVAGDCNDADNTIYPSAPELCDSKDNDCDGSTDEGALITYYRDSDGDAYGVSSSTTTACSRPSGYASVAGDCNDSNAAINPGATETCNGLDDDCDNSTDEGVMLTFYRDQDADAFGTSTTTQACSKPSGYASVSGDCNDSDNTIYPGAPELCDSKDNDCDSSIDEGALTTWYQDNDADTYGNTSVSQLACSKPTGYVNRGGDCNDSNASVNPGATEICNSIDDDCDSAVDEDVKSTFYVDGDSDGYGQTNTTTQACSRPTGYASVGGDCNDSNASVNPGAVETCNSVDDDCDGGTDEGLFTTYYRDQDSDGFGVNTSTTSACSLPSGYASTAGDCNDNDATIYPNAPEQCDGKDNDCDGATDETVSNTWYRDVDSDGYGISSSSTTSCNQPSGYAAQAGDCNDNDASVYPGATETCNSVDDDCDGSTDEGLKSTYYLDNDADSYGQTASSTQSCSRPTGYSGSSGDCDDTNAAVNPGATEACNNIDDDCDGGVDEGLKSTFYLDNDGDGFGISFSTTQACSVPSGYALVSGDCNDNDASVYPKAPELCDSKDNDCDGSTDEGALLTYYRDQDGDGYGQTSTTTQACSLPSGYSSTSGDCNDSNAAVYPGATEVCNNIDDNCDGIVDESLKSTFYRDSDADTYGVATDSVQSCSAPSGYVGRSGDCDDSDNTVYPGATELCDLQDNDCDAVIDEGAQSVFYQDRDSDSYGIGTVTINACSVPSGYASRAGDCDDTNANVNPSASELCNGIDDDCDGASDEGVKLTWYADVDGDGYGDASRTTDACSKPTGYVSNNTDCNDADPNTFPGASEQCDGRDNDCDSIVDEGVTTTYYQDADADTYGNQSVTKPGCERPAGYVSRGGDCNDANSSINPGAAESCDGIDQDCDSIIDDGVQTAYFQDNDQDGYGNPEEQVSACSKPSGYVERGEEDCDDTDPNVHPNAPEICNDLDDNCDDVIDEGVQTEFYADNDGDGYGTVEESESACSPSEGYVSNAADCDDTDDSIHPGATDICGDNIDQNCDSYDLSCDTVDADQDGYSSSQGDCNDSDGQVYPTAEEACDNKDNDCNGAIDDVDVDGDGHVASSCAGDDCDDWDVTTFAGAEELCDTRDNDCNGSVDDRDIDLDGYDDNACGGSDCDDLNGGVNPGEGEVCDAIDNNCDEIIDNVDQDGDGYIAETCGGDDCNDRANSINPGAVEVCNFEDDDCDGTSDEDTVAIAYADADGDGFGNPDQSLDSCLVPDGYVLDSTDCDDTSADIYPGAVELCDSLDNDCDAQIDENLSAVYYEDIDGDGFGNSSVSLTSCVKPNGYSANGGDCNDSAANVYPGATETCDGVDQDCDGSVDDGVLTTYYQDEDGDGYGNATASTQSCSRPAGYVGAGPADCNDFDANVHPNALEVCNDMDDDCDGDVDEDVQSEFYADQDGDGYGDPDTTTSACNPGSGFVDNNEDCDDQNSTINPDAVDPCGDGIDQNCDTYDLSCDTSDADGDGVSAANGDCDDNNSSVYPGAAEVCNGLDDDCNGGVDDIDADGDGFNDADCFGDDCDDDDEFVNPDALEVCDGIDNDCDALIDDIDADSDGYVDSECGGDDCDGANGGVNPGAQEYCDGIDNNCANGIDDVDLDVDGYIAGNCGGADCNDSDASTYPGADEVLDGIDNDCDLEIDESTTASDDDNDGYSEADGDCNDDDAGAYPGADELPDDQIDNDCDGSVDEGDETPTPSGSPEPTPDQSTPTTTPDVTVEPSPEPSATPDTTPPDTSEPSPVGETPTSTPSPTGPPTTPDDTPFASPTPDGPPDESPEPSPTPEVGGGNDAGGCSCNSLAARPSFGGAALAALGLLSLRRRRRRSRR